MEIWINKNKFIGLKFLSQHINKLQWRNNGAIKGIDKCYDLNIYFLGICFTYTNFKYNKNKLK